MIMRWLLNYLDFIAPLLPLIHWFLLKLKRSGPVVYLMVFLLLQLILNGYADILSSRRITNISIYQLNCLLSFALLSVYFEQIIHDKRVRNFIIGCIIFYVAFFILDTFSLENDDVFNSYTFSVASLIIIIYCLFYYLKQLLNPRIAQITSTHEFWAATGILFYNTGNFFIFLSYRFLTIHNNGDNGLLWRLHNCILLLMCILISIGFYYNSKVKNNHLP